MEVMKLSDNCPALLQLCAPCQVALRAGQIGQIKGPVKTGTFSNRSDSDYVWSCLLCSTIYTKLHSFQKNPKLWIISQLYNKVRNRITDLEPCRVGDLCDLIILGSSFTHSTPMFDYPLVPVLDITNPCRVPCKPILRIVPSKKIDLSLVVKWLSACESNHSACQQVSIAQEIQNQDQPGFIFIDVNRKRLVHRTATSRYLALSYVWGAVEQLQLTQATRAALEMDMSLSKYWNQIPQVIRDAIEFVEKIAEKYLWVDTLCIVQDSESRHVEIGRMNQIYRKAVCTLVALDAEDASGSLYGFRSNSRLVTSFARYNDLLIARKRPELAISFAASIYEQRAWTFQERFLSTRCLYFTREQVYFHCQSELWSEDRFEHFEQHADFFGSYPPLKWPSQSLLSRDRADHLREYGRLVTHYTRRKLSFQSDRLDAFSGIANSYGKAWDWSFTFGIPLAILHLSLLWISSTRTNGRIKDQRGKFISPSWSWAGWEDAVHYRLATTHIPESFIIELASTDSQDRYKVSAGGAIEHSCLLPPFEESANDEEDERSPKLVAPLQMSLDILSFETAAVHSRRFSFYRTQTYRPLWDDVSLGLARIFDENIDACGILFRSDAMIKMAAEVRAPNLQFILMGESQPGLFLTSIDDEIVEMNEVSGTNVLGGRYRFNKGKIFNVMLINWITEHYAERVTIGQIHEVAWRQAGPEMKRICLQ
jgi:hypothetical protein